jgi:hypothetical protein
MCVCVCCVKMNQQSNKQEQNQKEWFFIFFNVHNKIQCVNLFIYFIIYFKNELN